MYVIKNNDGHFYSARAGEEPAFEPFDSTTKKLHATLFCSNRAACTELADLQKWVMQCRRGFAMFMGMRVVRYYRMADNRETPGSTPTRVTSPTKTDGIRRASGWLQVPGLKPFE